MQASTGNDHGCAPMVRLAALGVATFALGAGCTTEGEPVGTSSAQLGRPPVSATVDGWIIRGQIEPGTRPGSARATMTFDDQGLGGLRGGGTCLVTDVGLGACDSVQDCVDAAIAQGLPGNGGVPGWNHYCLTAGGGRPQDKRCWVRPGTQGQLCQVGPNGRPGDIRGVEKVVTRLPFLDDAPRSWTAVGCLAGGTAPDGAVVGDPAGCARLTRYVYAVDHPIMVSGH